MLEWTSDGRLVQCHYAKHNHIEQIVSVLFRQLLITLNNADSTTCLGNVSKYGHLYHRRVFFCLNEISCTSIYAHWLLSCPWASLRRDWPHLLYCCVCDKIPPNPSIKQFHLSQPFLRVFTISEDCWGKIQKCNQSCNWLQERPIISRNLMRLSINCQDNHLCCKEFWNLMMKKQVEVMISHIPWQICSAVGLDVLDGFNVKVNGTASWE